MFTFAISKAAIELKQITGCALIYVCKNYVNEMNKLSLIVTSDFF